MQNACQSNGRRLLVASKVPDLGLVKSLTVMQWEVQTVAESRSLYLALLQHPAQIVLIASDLAPEGGLNVVRALRTSPSTSGAGLILLGETSRRCRVEALCAGADVVLPSSVDPSELVAQVQALARRVARLPQPQSAPEWHFFPSEWRLVSPSGKEVLLSHLEAAFLQFLVQEPGKPVRRRDIIAFAFSKDPMEYDYRRLEAVVSRLRRKIHRCYPLSQPIRVVHSVGYVFTEPMRLLNLNVNGHEMAEVGGARNCF